MGDEQQGLTLHYYDPARDFQSGVQTSQSVSAGRTLRQLEIPAVLSSSAAKRLADLQLLQAHREKESWSVDAAYGPEAFRAGEWVSDPDGRLWRIAEVEHRTRTTKIMATSSILFDPTVPKPASSGRNLEAPDLSAGQSHIVVIDLPVFGTVDPAKPQVAIFAGGAGTGWRRAALSLQDGSKLSDIGSTALPATMGHTLNALPSHNPALVDQAARVEIQLLNDGMNIAGIAGSPMSGNSGLCWIEGEFVRFGSAEALGDGRYRLSDLLRGCHGSEDAAGGHSVGDRFVLMEPESAHMIEDVALVPGSTACVEAMGLGDDEPVTVAALVTANAISPLRPAHLTASRLADGSIYLSWVRRSRIDFGWNDGVDQALVEDVEKYSVALMIGGQQVRQWITSTGEITIPAGEFTGPLFPGGTILAFEVRQIGRHMMSAPAIAGITIPV